MQQNSKRCMKKNNIYMHPWVALLTVLLATHFLSLRRLPAIRTGAPVRWTRHLSRNDFTIMFEKLWFWLIIYGFFDRFQYFWQMTVFCLVLILLVAITDWIKDLLNRCTSQGDQAEEQNGSGFLSFSCSNKLKTNEGCVIDLNSKINRICLSSCINKSKDL
jgi:hypothetical protein